ncbi:MAG TPA: GNAT family N-acetyltransferase [Pseudonocardiaceae bacterium]|nr:GNAT family N-acetyltransferase [Pseudonocardiaceae bacterium]
MAIAAVHPAEPADIPQVDRIQREVWQVAYAKLLPAELLAELAAIDTGETEQVWAAARERLLVATEGDWTVGVCAAGFAPDDDLVDANGTLPDDAETVAVISALLVEPRWGRRGHGGRLIATAAETLREQGATRGITWILEGDTVTRAFYARIGWQPDGIARTLDASGHPLREIRLAGDLDLTLKPSADQITPE